ncbi:hypothetical protein FO519_000463 [Halicephalobus sp. NKZ332]|nr:hypothetical protein FO519_000463 [Halicephalobus sp. NKZ332]
MISSADAILESLIGDVKTTYDGSIDIADIIAKSDTKLGISPPTLLVENSKGERRKHRKKKHRSSKSGDNEEKSKDKEDVHTKILSEGSSWTVELMEQTSVIDDIPVEDDFKVYYSNSRDSPEKKKKENKNKEKKYHKEKKHKHKKKSREIKDEEQLERDPNKLVSDSAESRMMEETGIIIIMTTEIPSVMIIRMLDRNMTPSMKVEKILEEILNGMTEILDIIVIERIEQGVPNEKLQDLCQSHYLQKEILAIQKDPEMMAEGMIEGSQEAEEMMMKTVTGLQRGVLDPEVSQLAEEGMYSVALMKNEENIAGIQSKEEDEHLRTKLMDVATKNVTKLAISGTLPKGYELLTTIKNKTISQLIALCKKLHDEDERARADRSSSSEDSEDEEKLYSCTNCWEENRLFSLKEPKETPAPKYEIIGEVVQQVKNSEGRKANEAMLRVSYPVSSGYEHRMKELEPTDEDVPQLPLMTALARIKTSIPLAFGNSVECDSRTLVDPLKLLDIPTSKPASNSMTEFSRILNPITGQSSSVPANVLSKVALSKPIEISKILESPPQSMENIVSTVVQKPIKIRASFLKSGKKAAEEVLNKILTSNPVPVPAPNIPTSVATIPQEVSLLPVTISAPVPPSISMIVEESQPNSTVPSEESKKKEITHSDHLSALLDKVDQVVSSGKIEEISKIEKKELPKGSESMNEIQTGDYVKIPGFNESNETVEKSKKKKNKEITEGLGASGLVDVDRNGKKKKQERKTPGSKVNKKRKSDEKDMEIKEKREKSELPVEVANLKEFRSQKLSEINYRDPVPFIQALTNPQLAITGIPTGSLKATWNDAKSTQISVNGDESMPMPFRIIPPSKDNVINPEDMVFKLSKCITNPPKVINELVSKRAQFVQALMTNPEDYYAKNKVAEIDQEMSAWAESKNIPGKFTGRTGARVLSADELGPSDPKYNAWARKDLFLNAPEHDSEFGRRIMEKYGWQKGSGLGKMLTGPVEPLSLGIKADRKGLAAVTDRKPGKNSVLADINGKNPISLVMEYCAKRKIQPPTFTCIERGPANSRKFLWKCTVDGIEYEPSMPAANKKTGKTEVCCVILQALGQIPPSIPD